MPEPDQDTNKPHQRTDFNDPVSGQLHTGSGDIINLAVLGGLSEAIALIRQLVPGQQMYIVKKIVDALNELNKCQKEVEELKNVHNMLHELEIALDANERQIEYMLEMLDAGVNANETQIRLRQKVFKKTWQSSVLPKISGIRFFAMHNIKFLGESLVIVGDNITGPLWATELIVLQDNFEKSLIENDVKEVHKISETLLEACRNHLFLVDKQLLVAVGRLNQISDFILRSLGNDTAERTS